MQLTAWIYTVAYRYTLRQSRQGWIFNLLCPCSAKTVYERIGSFSPFPLSSFRQTVCPILCAHMSTLHQSALNPLFCCRPPFPLSPLPFLTSKCDREGTRGKTCGEEENRWNYSLHMPHLPRTMSFMCHHLNHSSCRGPWLSLFRCAKVESSLLHALGLDGWDTFLTLIPGLYSAQRD